MYQLFLMFLKLKKIYLMIFFSFFPICWFFNSQIIFIVFQKTKQFKLFFQPRSGDREYYAQSTMNILSKQNSSIFIRLSTEKWLLIHKTLLGIYFSWCKSVPLFEQGEMFRIYSAERSNAWRGKPQLQIQQNS